MKEADGAGSTLELPAVETMLANEELEETMIIRQEEFVEFDGGKKKIEEELKDKKVEALIISLYQSKQIIFVCLHTS